MIENNLLTYNDARTVSGLALSRGFKKNIRPNNNMGMVMGGECMLL